MLKSDLIKLQYCMRVWVLPDQPGRSTFTWPSSCASTSAAPFVLHTEHTALCEKWLITITSSAGSHRLILLHSHSPSLSVPPSLTALFLSLLLLNFTRDQCCCQAIYLFRTVPQTKGPQKATAAVPQIWPASVNFGSRVSPQQWQAALDACGE